METMERKYYTPEISEFHVGFEYESYENVRSLYDEWDEGKLMWVKRTVLDINQVEFRKDKNYKAIYHVSINNHYEEDKEWNNTLRVPYLSKEDIEECGWEYNPVSSEKLAHNNHQMRGIYSSDMKDIRGNNFSLFHNIAENWILIWVSSSEHTHTLWDDKLTTMGETVFAGTIKNKSQLKELMKWLNIKK